MHLIFISRTLEVLRLLCCIKLRSSGMWRHVDWYHCFRRILLPPGHFSTLKMDYVFTNLNVAASQKSLILIRIAVRTSSVNERLFQSPNCGLYTDVLIRLYSPYLGLSLFFSFVIFYTQTVGLLGPVISPSQDLCLHTEQQNHRINLHNIHIHASSRIRTHDTSVRASKDGSCLRPRGRCDRHVDNKNV
jgi:hypothetical protein